MRVTAEKPGDEPSSWLRREEVVERFEQQWRSAGDAKITDYLEGDSEDQTALLLELIRVDLEYRWKRGEEAWIELYLRRFPKLGLAEDAPLELVLEEFQVRSRCGRLPDAKELLQRFPSRVAELQPIVDRLLLQASRREPVTPNLNTPTEAFSTLNSPQAQSATVPPAEALRTDSARELRQIGDYQISEQVGQGGFATVYRALDRRLRREVAIKVPRVELIESTNMRTRLEREARAAARLRHPAIVPIHEVGESDGLPFIVFEFISGPTLAELLKSSPLPTPEQSAWWTLQIAEALDYAHRQDLVHRDVKPSNILIAPPTSTATEPHEKSGSPLLSDFGLALHTDADFTLTQEGDLLGTPAYMSPEQARGKGPRVDARSDVYSLGVVLYEMLTGRRPFEGTTVSILAQLLRAEPTAPHQSRAGIPVDIETICLKAMAKEPGRRYQTAGQLAADLRRFLRHEPIHARRISGLGRLWLWSRRNPLLASTLVVSSAVIALVIGFSYWRVLEDRDRFRVQRETARANLYQSLIREARAIRLARSPGYQAEAWQRLKLALDVETPERNTLQLRNEAVASLGDFLGQPPTTWPGFGDNNYAVASACVPGTDLVAVGLTSGEVSFRKFANGEEVARHKHGDAGVFGLAFSADGRRMATADDRGGASVWERDSEAWSKRRDFKTAESAQPGKVLASTVLLTADGQQLLTCPAGTKAISYWSVDEGTLLSTFVGSKAEPFFHATLSPDGALLVAAYRDNVMDGFVVWDLARRERVRTMPVTSQAVLHVSFNSDGSQLACGTSDGAVVFDTSDWERHLFTKGDLLFATAFCPTKSWLALPSQSGFRLRIWDVLANREVVALPHASDPLSALFSPDGNEVTGIAATVAQTWNLQGDETRRSLSGHTGHITQLAFAPDSRRLVSTGRDNSIRVWDAASGRLLATQSVNLGANNCLNLTADGQHFALSNGNGDWQFWKLNESDTLTQTTHFSHGLGDYLWNCAMSRDGRILAASGHQGVAVWRAKPENSTTNSSLFDFELLAKPTDILSSSLSLSSDGRLVVWLDFFGKLTLWDMLANAPLSVPSQVSATAPHGITFLPDSHRFVVVAKGGQVQIWNADALAQPEFTSTPIAGQTPTSGPANFWLSSDGRWLANFGANITVWDLHEHETLFSLPFSTSIVTAAWSPDRRYLALGSSAGEILVWDVVKIQARLEQLGLAW